MWSVNTTEITVGSIFSYLLALICGYLDVPFVISVHLFIVLPTYPGDFKRCEKLHSSCILVVSEFLGELNL